MLPAASLVLALPFAAQPPDHRFHSGTGTAAIPFELNSNKIYVQVRLPDGKPRWFILDSGCPVTAVDMTLARELKLPLRNERRIGGAGEGRVAVADTELTSVTLPGLDLHPRRVWALTVHDPVSPFEGRRIDGLLGLDFIERFVVRIDYPNRTLAVHDPKDFRPPPGGVVVPLEKAGDHYAVRGSLRLAGGKTVEGRFVFDVGVRLPLLLNTPFVDRNGLIEATAAGPLRTVGGGLGGETMAHVGRVEALALGPLTVERPLVALSREKRSALSGDETQGILGAGLFKRYRLTLDLPHNRAVFEDTPEAKTPFEFDASGLFLVADGPDFRRHRVLNIVPDGPGAKAGVEQGDVLVSVDGKAAAEMTLEQVRAALREDGATRVLILGRGDKEVTARVALRRPE